MPSYGLILENQVGSLNKLNICTSIEFLDTSTLNVETGWERQRPGICGYCVNEAITVKQEGVRSSLSYSELFVDVNPCDHGNPFKDPPSNLHSPEEIKMHEFIDIGKTDRRTSSENDDIVQKMDAKTVLGRNVAFASELFARQQRLFCFSIFVIGSTARLLRWDRSGVVVSRSFDYKSHPESLRDFLRRFDAATAEQRGYDPSVTRASLYEEEMFAKRIREEVAFQLGLDEVTKNAELDEAMSEHYSRGRVMRMEVYNERLNKYEPFLICKPVQSPTSMAGRATRGYWGVKVDEVGAHKVFFIKDNWRPTDKALRREEDAYEELNNDTKKITNVGTMYCGGPQVSMKWIPGERDNESVCDVIRTS